MNRDGRALPLVSCIMPTCDRRLFVPQAVRYFLSQDYPRRELLILDDGRESVRDLVPDDPRVRYLREERKSPVGTKRNLLCEEARGEVIVHWDDDDWMAPWRLSYQVERLLDSAADLCGLERLLFYDIAAGRSWQYVYPRRRPSWVAGGTLCYTNSFWRSHRFSDLGSGEDTQFVWNGGPKRLAVLEDFGFYVAMIHAGNTCRKLLADPPYKPHPAEATRELLGRDRWFYEGLARRRGA